MSILLKELNGAKPVIWKFKVSYAPPDCGGEDQDSGSYIPVCPNCGKEFDSWLDRPNYCPNCGTKLWWKVTHPDIGDMNF